MTIEQEPLRIVELDVDPQQDPDFQAEELLLPDDEELARQFLDEQAEQDIDDEFEDEKPDFLDRAPIDRIVVVDGRKKHPLARKVGTIGVAAAVIVGGSVAGMRYLQDNIFPKFHGPKASHSLDVEIGAPTTVLAHDVSINFAEVESEFRYNQHTSLDRFGPSNCDMDIDQQVHTFADAKILVEDAVITQSLKSATIEISGDITANAMIDIDEGQIDIDMASGGVDACKGDNEVKWAKRISSSTIKDAGNVAVACAMKQEGEDALSEAIVYNAQLFSPDLKELKPEDIKVIYEGDTFSRAADAMHDKATADLFSNFGKLADEYYGETDDHTKATINATQLVDCEQNKVTVKPR